MFKKIKEFFLGKPEESVVEVVSAPYKMPEPAATTPIPLVVQHDMGGSYTPESVAEVAPVVAEVAAPAKAARKPRTPKVVAAPVKAVKAVKEKAPAKAKASNVVAMKAPVKAKSKK